MVVQEAAARHDEAGGVVIELGEAVGGLRDERAVVPRVASDAAQALEGLHTRTLPGMPWSPTLASSIPGSESGAVTSFQCRRCRRPHGTQDPLVARRRARSLARRRP